MTAAVMASNMLARRPAARFGPWPVIACGAVLTALGALGALALLGSVQPSRSGVASGTLNSARQVGSVIGVAVYGSLLARGRLTSGLHLALWSAAGLAATVFACACVAAAGHQRSG
jgi:DHA2 family methylenomycin A resistance protein-like MFS transporter